jgi:hypothetical protein
MGVALFFSKNFQKILVRIRSLNFLKLLILKNFSRRSVPVGLSALLFSTP